MNAKEAQLLAGTSTTPELIDIVRVLVSEVADRAVEVLNSRLLMTDDSKEGE